MYRTDSSFFFSLRPSQQGEVPLSTFTSQGVQVCEECLLGLRELRLDRIVGDEARCWWCSVEHHWISGRIFVEREWLFGEFNRSLEVHGDGVMCHEGDLYGT